MEDFLLRSATHLVARLGDWLSFRFLIQPTVAAVLAIRAGARDARADRPPFGWAVLRRSSARSMLLRDAWRDIATLFCVAAAIDIVYQLVVLRWIYPLQALIVAATLAVVPYVLIRGPCNRLLRRGGVREGPDRWSDAAGHGGLGRGTKA